ncbi:molybdate ABC transporter permease subunit [Oscillatoria sp. CS-180]|uniref:molybdate ABC transporter permease subunit n=1 Tax=Oscillatoria sp. CS-180 TaxID=3021720 RepID=UPI00232BBA7D|nr:molybdate ABC transporter permease subunit [Oscillatoria sp. CS-180]MDB9527249.1 molybdate ABC transporter permease subunit [Oscillatoria sp. CS-180]
MPEDLTPLWISLKTAIAATVLATGFGIVVARWMLSYRGKARGLIDGILTLPLVLPPTVIGFLLLLLLGKNSPVGQLLNQVGISVIFTWAAAVIAATVVTFPLMYKTVLSAFEQVDLTLINSARTLGASEWRIFWQILLPLAWPGVLAGMVLAFARALGEFGATLMVGGSIPGVTQTIPIAIFFAAEAGRMGVALAWVLLMIAASLAVIAGINYGNRGKSHKKTAVNEWVKRGFNWVLFRSLQRDLFSLSAAKRPWQKNAAVDSEISSENYRTVSGTQHRKTVALAGRTAREKSENKSAAEPLFVTHSTATVLSHPAPNPVPEVSQVNAELVVKIEKQVPGFHLKVNFVTNHAPLGLLGASGSGKSMTLRCIAGLETPSQGRIVLNGRVLFDSHKRINVPSRDRKVGLVFQNYALFPHLTVAQNIAFGLANMPKPQRATEVMRYLDQIGLTGLGDRYPHQLSGGQQQRVALARALAIQPDILLLDEPLSALDTYLRSHIEKLLVEVLSRYQGITLFITHKLEEAYRVCSNLLVLSNGEVQAEGTKEEIFERPPTFEVAKVTECKNFSRARRLDDYHVEALDWGCRLQVKMPMPSETGYIGLRAHHVKYLLEPCRGNTFPGWLAMVSETQHRVTLYIKLHSEPTSPQDYHLQAEIHREKWASLQKLPFPWPIWLDPNSLITLKQ